MAYTIVAVDMAGTPYGTLTNATLTSLSWELNGPGAAAFTMATTDADADLAIPGREIQIYNNGDLIFWGPIVRPQAGLRETTWQCAGLLWYFDHRFMGRADRVNLLTNGDFEAGETGWSFSGVTHAIDTGTVLEGSKSEKLTGTTADHITYASQTYTHTTQYFPTGDAITVAAWVRVPTTGYVGGAFEDWGLMARHLNSVGTVIDAQVTTINDDTVKDVWLPVEVVIPNVMLGDTIQVRLYPPHGIAYWDLVTLTLMESLSFGYPDGVDAADIASGIVDYAQDNDPAFTHGKSDLLIGTAGGATGTLLTRVYQFAEHRNIGDALTELTRLGILDFDIALTTTTRTFTTYAKSADARGLGKGVLYGTTLELDVNVADFTYSWDGEQGASSVVLLGPGDGPDRPEGGAVDASFLGGAYTMEIVETAPDDVTIGQLDARAAERLAVAARPEILEVTTLPGSGVIGDLLVGDTVPIDITHGWVTIADTYRVVRIQADLLMDQATISLNPLP